MLKNYKELKVWQKGTPFKGVTDKSGRLNNQHGFTIVEVIIAISIFAVGILAIGTMQITALLSNATSREVTEASNWAQDRVEQLMAIEYDPSSIDPDLDPDQYANHTATESVYTIAWTVNNHATIANALSIRVVVSWWDLGKIKNVSFDFVKTVVI